MPAFTEYSIASGWNNVVGLVKIGLIVATANIAFPEPAAQGGFTAGINKVRLDQQITTVGINRQVWMLHNLTYEQYRYLQTAYFGGGFSGKMTVRTRWQHKSYANYNCIGQLESDNLQTTLQGYSRVSLTFLDLTVIP